MERNTKNQILQRIRNNKPAPSPLPVIPSFPFPCGQLTEVFGEMVQTMGGRFLLVAPAAFNETFIQELYPSAERIASAWPDVAGNVPLRAIKDPGQLEGIDLAIIPTHLGVAENGSVWITEQDFVHRALPFIAEHVLFVLSQGHIVPDMHEAYRHIDLDKTGFSVFVAGPSKTADIEQSLVIGAQGPRSMTVVCL
jgi:L-lactate dehydrogenase complex protein LldG